MAKQRVEELLSSEHVHIASPQRTVDHESSHAAVLHHCRTAPNFTLLLIVDRFCFTVFHRLKMIYEGGGATLEWSCPVELLR